MYLHQSKVIGHYLYVSYFVFQSSFLNNDIRAGCVQFSTRSLNYNNRTALTESEPFKWFVKFIYASLTFPF